MMKIDHRSFVGKTVRPSPYVYESENMVAILTPWNTTVSKAKEATKFLKETYLHLASDTDSTRPYAQMQSLSNEENNLQMSCLQLNQHIFDQYNQNQLSIGFELFVITKENSKLVFAQIGCPHIYIGQNKSPLQSISPSFSLSTSCSNKIPSTDPLPQTLLGLFSDINIRIHSIHLQSCDHIVLMSRSSTPVSFLKDTEHSLESLSRTIVAENNQEPFWLGILNIT